VSETGWPQSRKKIPGVFQAFPEAYCTFPEVTATKSMRNNDLHLWRVIPH